MGELYSKPELFIKFRCQRCVLWQHVEKKGIVMVELQKAGAIQSNPSICRTQTQSKETNLELCVSRSYV